MAFAANASRRTGILQTFLKPYALVVGAGLLLGGTDHISWKIDFLANAGALEYRRDAGEAVVTAARRVLQKAAAAFIAEAVINGFANTRRRNAPAAVNPLRYLANSSFDRTLAAIRMDLD